MAEPLIVLKTNRCKLLPEAIEAIEEILSSDETAKVVSTRKGIAVYRERLKKAYPQS